ncbi:MAG TPA: ABC transporter ATP-binding protein [Candidatus Obscuribacterales bacterium]
MTSPVIETKDLTKDHFSHILRRRFRAVDGLTLTVERNETYGLLGLNGAGKTTTLKLLLGLLRPTSGSASVLGYPAGDQRALGRLGFLPENPYFYSYLTGGEFLDFSAEVFGLSAPERKERAQGLLKMVSMTEAANVQLWKYSKGMLQRLGIAQALINDPEVIFLDEPMSGLDPIGRRDVRLIMLKLKEQGKTVFFNSHLLPDVNEVCDRVGVLHRGKLVADERVATISGGGSYRDLEEYFLETVSRAEAERQAAAVSK